MLKKYSIVAFSIALIIFCYYSPTIDTTVAKLPYNQSTHQFYGNNVLWCNILYSLIPIITVCSIVIPLGFIVFSSKTGNSLKSKIVSSIIICSLVLGPGLVVNSIFKQHWGRPRPSQVITSSNEHYEPFWELDFHDSDDNSFPSGHAAIGFFAGVPLLALGRRKIGMFISLICGSLIGIVRILQGGHYVSDIVFAGIFVWLSAELVKFYGDKLFKRFNT
jgi:lipid A 4'-phosphatase